MNCEEKCLDCVAQRSCLTEVRYNLAELLKVVHHHDEIDDTETPIPLEIDDLDRIQEHLRSYAKMLKVQQEIEESSEILAEAIGSYKPKGFPVVNIIEDAVKSIVETREKRFEVFPN